MGVVGVRADLGIPEETGGLYAESSGCAEKSCQRGMLECAEELARNGAEEVSCAGEIAGAMA